MIDAFVTKIFSGDLLAHHACDDGSATIATDSSDNGNHGVIKGVAWITGKSGNRLSFDEG